MVDVGVTVVEVPVTVVAAAVPACKVSDVAPLTDQARVEDCPWLMLAGVAVKEEITGLDTAALTVTVVEQLPVNPPAPVNVAVYVVVWPGAT